MIVSLSIVIIVQSNVLQPAKQNRLLIVVYAESLLMTVHFVSVVTIAHDKLRSLHMSLM